MITERVGKVTYRLELPPKLSKVHDVFHVSMLRHYVANPTHVIPPQPLEINPNLTYNEKPVTILDWKDKELRNKIVSDVSGLDTSMALFVLKPTKSSASGNSSEKTRAYSVSFDGIY
ncbi:uncharacterized protein [Malus domestica]|uniref:uncharacterized protein n=1 Tax=Malus domestica TaxID=3750 RepID=UPI0039756966